MSIKGIELVKTRIYQISIKGIELVKMRIYQMSIKGWLR